MKLTKLTIAAFAFLFTTTLNAQTEVKKAPAQEKAAGKNESAPTETSPVIKPATTIKKTQVKAVSAAPATSTDVNSQPDGNVDPGKSSTDVKETPNKEVNTEATKPAETTPLIKPTTAVKKSPDGEVAKPTPAPKPAPTTVKANQ